MALFSSRKSPIGSGAPVDFAYLAQKFGAKNNLLELSCGLGDGGIMFRLRWAFGLACAFLSLLETSSLVNAQGRDIPAALAEVAKTYGPQIVSQMRKRSGYEMPTSELPADVRSAALEDTYARYTELRSQYASARNSASWFSLGVSSGAAVAAAVVGPQAALTIPIMLTAAAISTVVDVGNEELEDRGAEVMRTYLRANEDRIVSELGLTFEQMRADPIAAADALKRGAEVFADLRERAGDDEAVWRQSQELITRTLVETDRAQWEKLGDVAAQAEKATEDVARLSRDLSEFRTEVDRRFGNLEAAFENMGEKVGLLEDAVVEVNARVTSLETNQAVIADFVLDSMSPAQKVAAIRDRGFLADRFTCPNGGTSCDAAKLKDAMIERFTREADLRDALTATGRAVGALNNVNQIAADLGIESPELQMAVRVSNAAMGAFQNFASGNYLGAVASVTGLFAKRKDPDAERHKILMGYLQDQFAIINRRLDAVLRNQQIILERIDALGRRMNEGFLSIDRQLSNLAFEQARIDLGVRRLLWAPWKPCYTVYAGVLDESGGPSLVDPVTLLLRNEEALREAQSTLGRQALECWSTMQSSLAAAAATERFGQFLSVDWAIDVGLSQAGDLNRAACQTAHEPDGTTSTEWRSLMKCFREDVFDPAFGRFLQTVTQDDNFEYANAYVMLARPMGTTDDWAEAYNIAAVRSITCPVRSGPDARLAALLCPADSMDPSSRALELMRTPILADAVNDVADWVMVMAQLVDMRDQVEERWLSYSDVLDRASEGALPVRRPLGQWMIERSIGVVDMAIATYAMTYGPILAEAVATDIEVGGDAADRAIAIARDNPYAARNLAQIWLERRYQAQFPESGMRRPARTAYQLATEMAATSGPGRFLLLEGLFGADETFVESIDGRIAVQLQVGEETLDLPLPGTGAMVEGRLHWPARYHELLATRDQLVDRLAGYTVLDRLSEEALVYMTFVMTEPR